jgi:hypothetical protein
METGSVGHIRTASEHPGCSALNGTGLTVDAGKWAFCLAGESGGPRWRAITKRSLAELTPASTAAHVSELVDR